jgi:hypothetical protein
MGTVKLGTVGIAGTCEVTHGNRKESKVVHIASEQCALAGVMWPPSRFECLNSGGCLHLHLERLAARASEVVAILQGLRIGCRL